MSMTLDLTGIEAWKGGGSLPPGTHYVEIDDATEGTSTGSHPQFEVRYAALDPEHVGATVRDWITITQASLGRVRSFLEAAGVPIPEGAFQIAAADLVGCRLSVVIREQEYGGETKLRVVAYERPTSPDGTPLAQPQPAPRQGAVSGVARVDEDIPF